MAGRLTGTGGLAGGSFFCFGGGALHLPAPEGGPLGGFLGNGGGGLLPAGLDPVSFSGAVAADAGS